MSELSNGLSHDRCRAEPHRRPVFYRGLILSLSHCAATISFIVYCEATVPHAILRTPSWLFNQDKYLRQGWADKWQITAYLSLLSAATTISPCFCSMPLAPPRCPGTLDSLPLSSLVGRLPLSWASGRPNHVKLGTSITFPKRLCTEVHGQCNDSLISQLHQADMPFGVPRWSAMIDLV